MNFGRAFTYVTEDQQWLQKLAIAAVIMLIPIVGPITVIGWALTVTQRVINGEPETPLNDWSNFADYLTKGFQVFVIGFAYALPIILVSVCAQSVQILPSLVKDSQAVSTLLTILGVVSLCFSCVTILYEIVLAFVLPAAIGNFAATGQLGAAFRFSEVFGLLRAAPGPYFMVFLGSIVASIVAGLGLIVCFIGVFFTAVYAYMINAQLWGQAYRVAKGMAGTPAAPLAQSGM